MVDDNFASDVNAVFSGPLSLNRALLVHHRAKGVRQVVILGHRAVGFDANSVGPLFADKGVLRTERIGLDRVRGFRKPEVINRCRPAFRDFVLGAVRVPECLKRGRGVYGNGVDMSLFRLVQTMALTILIASSAAYRRNDASRKGPKSSPLAAAKSIVDMWSRTLSAILTNAAKESASIFRIICPR